MIESFGMAEMFRLGDISNSKNFLNISNNFLSGDIRPR
jgi:hypothetical protein